MIKIEPYSKEIHFDQVKALIVDHNDGRLLNSSIDKFTNYDSEVIGFVAIKGGKVVGFTGLCGKSSITVVHPFFRGEGIATKLMKAKLDYLDITEVGLTNVAMIKILLKLGFEVVHIGQRESGNYFLRFRKKNSKEVKE